MTEVLKIAAKGRIFKAKVTDFHFMDRPKAGEQLIFSCFLKQENVFALKCVWLKNPSKIVLQNVLCYMRASNDESKSASHETLRFVSSFI